MACPNCETLFTGDFLCVNITREDNTVLEYGVQFQTVTPGPGIGQTTVTYQICNCNLEGMGTGISHFVFQLCQGGLVPAQAIVNGSPATVVEGDPFFNNLFPNFKIEGFTGGGLNSCLTVQLIYNAQFGPEALQPGQFGIKTGGGASSQSTTGTVGGLLIPCVIQACKQNVTSLVCTSANVSIIPSVTSSTPNVNCVPNTLNINPVGNPCPGFTPTNTGTCSFNVSQVICVSIPLTFFADVNAVQNGTGCGPVQTGTTCPPLPGTDG